MTSIENYEAQIKEEQKRLENEFSCSKLQPLLDFEVTNAPGFAADEVLTILAFLVSSVTAGILAEAGKDIWTKTKETCHRVISRQKKFSGHHITEIRVAVQQTAGEVTFLYVLKTEAKIGSDELESAIDTFWETVSAEIGADLSADPPIPLLKEFEFDALHQRAIWLKRER